MSFTVTAVAVSELTTGNELFRCEPYNCTMLARACVERQAKAELGLEAITLLKCKGCELGAQVRSRATDVSFTERELLKGARGSGHHRSGVLGKKLRGARSNPDPDAPPEQRITPRRSLPIIGLELAAAPVPAELPPAFTTVHAPVAAACAATNTKQYRGTMPSKAAGLIGKEIAGVKVLRELPNEGEGSLCQVLFPCGHQDKVLAFVLNGYAKNGTTRRCKVCRAAKATKPAAEVDASRAPTAAPARKPRAKSPEKAPRKVTRESPAPPVPALSKPTESKSYDFPLRRDFSVTITLPADLRSSDVQRFHRWLETLAFDDAVAAE